tara:strand:- start:42 stop:182 length:141 start_codon:yes stop_codon:yes gene_type:complete
MGNLPKITKWRRNGDPAIRYPDWAGHTNDGKSKKTDNELRNPLCTW